ncbi:MAG TPA: hypothetical protein VFP50_19135 [Anaeromyxobacteraceae bacterium]|nr:hypothetical protein [Anaeromyxobacteraceae bacterium]
MRHLAAVSLLAVLAGCATTRPAWVPTEEPLQAAGASYSVQAPAGWMRRNVDSKSSEADALVVTRDGTALQKIACSSVEVGKPVGFGTSKRTVEAGMSPAELGELVLDGLRTEGGITDLQAVETAPARLAERDGFHLLTTFRDHGLAKRASLFGVLEGRRLYLLYYVAPERLYFERDRSTFVDVVRSFKLKGAPPAKAPAQVPAA